MARWPGRSWMLAALAVSAPAEAGGTVAEPIEQPVDFRLGDALAHRLDPEAPIRLGGVSGPSSVFLAVIVDRSGRVASAVPLGGDRAGYAAAVARAATWSYTPFVSGGVPVPARVPGIVRLLPPEAPLARHVAFPAVTRSETIRMSLVRVEDHCATCQAYDVEVDGDGTVTYTGRENVAITGRHTDRLAVDAVAELIAAFRRADFYSFEDAYRGSSFAGATTSISIGPDAKSVADHGGPATAVPQALSNLDDAIDRIAGTAMWVKGTADGVASLRRDGFDFASAEATDELATLAAYGTREGIRAFLAAGVAVTDNASTRSALEAAVEQDDREIATRLLDDGVAAGDAEAANRLLHLAATRGDARLVDLLIGRGAEVSSLGVHGRPLLIDAAASDNVELMAALLQRRAPVNGADERGMTALFAALPGLGIGRSPVETAIDRRDPVPVIRLLAAAGADLDHQDGHGCTALHYAVNAAHNDRSGLDAARTLIQLGARLNIRDAHGRTPLHYAISPEAALLLIRAGADSSARDDQGSSILHTALDKSRDPSGAARFDAAGWREVVRTLALR